MTCLRHSAFAGLALAFLAAFGAAAQTAPRSAEPGARLDPLPAPPPSAAPRVTLSEPVGESPNRVPGEGVDLRLTLKAVKFIPDGARLAGLPDLRRAADEAVGKVVGFPELEALRRTLTETLVGAGHVSSGARLREIDLDAGVAVYEIVEGHLTGVRVSGDGVAAEDRALGELSAEYIEARLAPPAGPFNVNDVEESLRVLLRDRSVERVDAGISPGVGRYIAFASNGVFKTGDAGGDTAIYFFDTMRQKFLLVPSIKDGGATSFDMSDDGKRIVFATNEAIAGDDTNGLSDIYVANINLSNFTLSSRERMSEAENRFQVFDNDSGAPTISSDGDRIAFLSNAQDLSFSDFSSGNGQSSERLFVLDLGSRSLTTRRSRPAPRLGTARIQMRR